MLSICRRRWTKVSLKHITFLVDISEPGLAPDFGLVPDSPQSPPGHPALTPAPTSTFTPTMPPTKRKSTGAAAVSAKKMRVEKEELGAEELLRRVDQMLVAVKEEPETSYSDRIRSKIQDDEEEDSMDEMIRRKIPQYHGGDIYCLANAKKSLFF